MRNQKIMKGLSIVAGLWIIVAVGLAVGAGSYIMAGMTSIVLLTILIVIKMMERKIIRNANVSTIIISLEDREDIRLKDIEDMLRYHQLRISEINWIAGEEDAPPQIRFVLASHPNCSQLMELIDELESLHFVKEIRFAS